MLMNTFKAPISVIIPCYRCATTIERAVQSVINQSQQPSEIILVDDASADDTLRALQKIEQQYPDLIQVIRLIKNSGASAARNKGWNAASQPYIAFLDSDDSWHPQKIELQYTYMRTHPDVILSGHGYKLLSDDQAPLDWKTDNVTAKPISQGQLLLSNRFITPSVMLKRDIKARFIDTQRYMEDHMLWLTIIFEEGRIVKLDNEIAAIYKKPFGVTGLSSHLWLMEKGELGNYQRLYHAKHINIFQLGGFLIYSLLKYVRRLMIYWNVLQWKK